MPLGEVAEAVQQLPAVKNLPPGVKVVEIGDAEVMGELFASFGLAMLTGVLCIYVVLVLLFKDFLHPVTILSALPLSLGGAFVGLLLAQKSFSMPSLIGLIMLMGIATKNSILLVEYAIVARRDHGLGRFEALLDAPQACASHHHDHHRDGRGHAAHRHRLRHRRPELPLADGDRGDRRPGDVHGAEPAGGAGGVRNGRRPGAVVAAAIAARPRALAASQGQGPQGGHASADGALRTQPAARMRSTSRVVE